MDDFFDRLQAITGISKYSNAEVITPLNIVKDMVNLLPAEIFKPEAKFLDPAVKSGRFLAEIYRRLFDSPMLADRFPNEADRRRHILENQLYGLATSATAATITRKQLYDDPTIAGNVVYIDHYLTLMADKGTDFRKLIEKEFGQMKFDVVIGNPPYQKDTGGGNNGGKAIYDKFIYAGLSTSSKVCMIVKNNWMNSDSLKELREKVVESGLKVLTNYSLLGDAFPGTGIAASIIYMDQDYSGDVAYTEVRNNTITNSYIGNLNGIGFIPSSVHEYTVVKKVLAIGAGTFDQYVIGNNPFGIDTNGAISGGFIDESVIATEHYNIAIKYADTVNYTCIDCIDKNIDLVDMYKVISPKQIHKTNNPIPSVLGLKPKQICSGSFSLMYCDTDVEKALRVVKYIKTRLFRFLVFCLADTLCRLNSYRVSLVPDQDFTATSDIDWSQSVADIDKQLYDKYNLSPDEIEYIENTIKPME